MINIKFKKMKNYWYASARNGYGLSIFSSNEDKNNVYEFYLLFRGNVIVKEGGFKTLKKAKEIATRYVIAMVTSFDEYKT